MAKTKLTVVTDAGTFTRTTARTYTHLVVVKGYKAERLEASRQGAIKNTRKELASYKRTVETGQCQDARPGRAGDFDRETTAKFLAEGRYAKWIEEYTAELARLEAMGTITQDSDNWSLSGPRTEPTWGILGWCGRLDLARKLAASATDYREVRIYDVATGQETR